MRKSDAWMVFWFPGSPFSLGVMDDAFHSTALREAHVISVQNVQQERKKYQVSGVADQTQNHMRLLCEATWVKPRISLFVQTNCGTTHACRSVWKAVIGTLKIEM